MTFNNRRRNQGRIYGLLSIQRFERSCHSDPRRSDETLLLTNAFPGDQSL